MQYILKYTSTQVMAHPVVMVVLVLTISSTVLSSEIMEYCMTDADCTVPESRCLEEGANTGMKRCQCRVTYMMVLDETTNTYYCALETHEADDVNCTTCEDNGGVCYMDLNDTVQCHCPSVKSGDLCQNVHVEVFCDVVGFKMVVCYTPHGDMGYTDNALIHTDTYMKDMACRAVKISGGTDPHCGDGAYKLTLPLDEHMSRCGTSYQQLDMYTRQYENIIVAHEDKYHMYNSDAMFKTFCAFETAKIISSKAVGVISVSDTLKGAHKAPALRLSVENLMGRPIPSGIPLRLGDRIKLKIKVTDDGTYAALRVIRCTASNRPTSIDPKAMTIPLVMASCPYQRQRILNSRNFFKQVSPTEIVTGILRMFKMAVGNTVHIHCTVMLCLTGSESACEPLGCGPQSSLIGYGKRKKRDVKELPQTVEVEVHHEITVMDEDGPDAKLQKPRSKRMMFIVTIGAGGLLVLLTLCLLGWWYLGESKDTDDEVAEVKPGQHDEMCPRKPGLPAVILAGEITGITHGTEGFTCHNTGNGYAGKSRK